MWFATKIPDNLSNREKDRLTAYVGSSDSDMNLVGQYENAINILINKIVEEKSRIDIIAYPLLYLMRHTIELALKENIKYLKKYSKLNLGKIKSHNLEDLLTNFETHYTKIEQNCNFDIELKKKCQSYISELKSTIKTLGIDSSSFRYVNSFDESKIFEFNKTINIFELKNKFDNSMIFLTHNSDTISPYTNYIDYIKYDRTIETESLKIVLYLFDKSERDWLIENLNQKYELVIKHKKWFDKNMNYYVYLKSVNLKLYVIPMKK